MARGPGTRTGTDASSHPRPTPGPGDVRLSLENSRVVNSHMAHFGVVDEWHLDFYNSFEHMEFDLLPRPLQLFVSPGPFPDHAGLEPVGPVGDAVHGDGPEQLLVEFLLVVRVVTRPVGDQRPERF